jgi:class 3 adenylate cyclase
MQCSRCQTENRAGRRFCAQCGGKLPLPCAACGFANEPGESFCGGCGAPLGTPVPHVAPPPSPPPVAGPEQAERRQLTVMFCDLADAAALSMQLDPEVMSIVVRAHQQHCTKVIERFRGLVAKYMGDGILIYFGFPQAHEDDAERAVLAALAITREVPALRPHGDLVMQVRIGIATGLVVVGELIGQGASQEQAVVGQTPNLAARLQSAAEPDSIVISAATQRLTGRLFDCRDMGLLTLKGFGEPVQAWQVLRESHAESRFEALRAERIIPVIGRDPELELLLDRWRQAEAGAGQVVLLSGEAGVGKSRLTSALKDRLALRPHIRLSYYCSPHHQTSALYPIIAEFERAAGITSADANDQKLDKLERVLGGATASTEMVSSIAALLSIQTGDRYPKLALTPAQLKASMLRMLLVRLEQLALLQPAIIFFEDVHWVDPTSLELITQLIQRLKTLPVLLVITCRPEFDASAFSGPEHVSELSLNRLTRQQAAAMVGHCAGGKEIPAQVLDEIVAKADGVPLFLEELTKTVLESGLLTEQSDRFTLDGPLPPLAVPATLHDSLMARLDRMSTVKQLAQLAATMGRSFAREQLAAVSVLRPAPLDDALAQLVAAEVIYREDRPPKILYHFKHALLRDVAYHSLLKATRQQYHGRIARALEQNFPDIIEMQPELLAYHFAEAGQVVEAIGYWLRAGERAAQRSSNLEAIAQLQAALAQVDGIRDPAERVRTEYRLRLALITPLTSAKGYTSPEMAATIARAMQLSAEIGDAAEILPVLYSRHMFEMSTGQIRKGLQNAEEARRLGERYPQTEIGAFVARLRSSATLFSGDPKGARPFLEQAVAYYDFEKDRSSAYAYSQDSFVFYASYLCIALLHLGEIERARDWQRRVLAHARSLSHVYSLCVGLAYVGCFFEGLLRDGPAVAAYAAESAALCAEHTVPVWAVAAKISMGHALAEQGRPADAVGMMTEGIAELDAMGIKLWRPLHLTWLATAYGKAGQPEAGLQALADARAVAEGGERWMDAEFHRLEGELLAITPGTAEDEIETCFLDAVRVAQAQNMLFLELRAATSLGRFWGRRAKAAAARRLLDGVLARFDSSASIVDLEEARAVRDSLE